MAGIPWLDSECRWDAIMMVCWHSSPVGQFLLVIRSGESLECSCLSNHLDPDFWVCNQHGSSVPHMDGTGLSRWPANRLPALGATACTKGSADGVCLCRAASLGRSPRRRAKAWKKDWEAPSKEVGGRSAPWRGACAAPGAFLPNEISTSKWGNLDKRRALE